MIAVCLHWWKLFVYRSLLFLYHRDIGHKKQSIKQLVKLTTVWTQAKATVALDEQMSSQL